MKRMDKKKLAKFLRIHKFLIIALCWTPAWALVAGHISQGDVHYILLFLAMCWTGYSIAAIGTHLVHKWENEKHEKDKE